MVALTSPPGVWFQVEVRLWHFLILGQGAITIHEFLLADFGWRSIAEAFSGCAVELVADGIDLPCGQALWICLTREPASDTALGILDRAFLPRRLRVAKPGGDAEPCLKTGPGQELQPAVEGDRAACMGGQRRQAADLTIHHRA